jgi:hypothetical protein
VDDIRRQRATEEEFRVALGALDLAPHRVMAAAWPARLAGLGLPGLYSWWVDDEGAEALTEGLGVLVPSGRIYAGQTGATKWPSGKRGSATLWSRIGRNHLAGTIRASTFRRTLAASLLRSLELELVAPGRLAAGSEQRLSRWMRERLEVAVHAFADADALADLEQRVLTVLDPPLNLEGMPPTPTRDRRSALRTELGRPSQTTQGQPTAPPTAQPPGEIAPAQRGSRPTLHEEILAILEEAGGDWMTTAGIATRVNARGHYRKRDGSAVTAFQVARRSYNYSALFEIDGSRIRPALGQGG